MQCLLQEVLHETERPVFAFQAACYDHRLEGLSTLSDWQVLPPKRAPFLQV